MSAQKSNKSRGRHTAKIDLANDVYKIIEKLKTVKGISLAIIKNLAGSSNAKPSVKIAYTESGLELTVKQGGSIQKMFVYTTDKDEGLVDVKESLEKEGIKTHLHKQIKN